MNLNAPFYYPVVLHDNQNVVNLLAPTVENLPVLPDVPVVILPQDVGNRVQGLYAYKGRCWYLVLPLHEVSRSIIRGDVLSIYANLTAAMPVPNGSFAWANGGRYQQPDLAPGTVMYLLQTPPSASGGGSVSSVNGQTGIVTINAGNLPGLSTVGRTGSYADLTNAPVLATVATSGDYNDLNNKPAPLTLDPATATALGGVSVPVAGNLAVTAQGALSLSETIVNTINSKIGAAQSAGSGVSLIQSATASLLSLRSLTGAGTITITEDGAGNITLTGANSSYTLPTASVATLGGVRVGTGLAIDGAGILSLNYTMPAATITTLGAVKVGTGLAVTADGTLSATAVDYTLPAATTTTLGGVSVGSGLTVTAQGALSATPYTLPAATVGALGGVRVGTGLAIDGAGILSATGGDYTLPTASATILGGVKVGNGLAIAGDGTLSAAVPAYELPAATTTTLGGVSVGAGLAVTAQGLLSAAIASAATVGGVRVGNGLVIDGAGILSATGGDYTLPVATASVLGGVKAGANLTVAADGTLSAAAPYSLPEATASVLGGVKIGANVTVAGDGTISVAAPYSLPTASAATVGGVRVGAGLSIDGAGILSANGSVGVSSFNTRTGAVVLSNDDVNTALGYFPVNKGGDAMAGALSEAPMSSVAISAGILNVTSANTNAIMATGTGTITSLGTAPNGAVRRVLFEGSATLVHNASTLILPTGANIAVQAGDVASFVGDSTGWRCISYLRANGQALAGSNYTLPVATDVVLGGVKAGSNVTIAGDGALSVAAPYSLPAATTTTLGGVSVGTGLAVDGAGVLSATPQAPVIATAGTLGSIRVGAGLSIDPGTGVLSSAGGGVTSFNTRTGAVTLASVDVTTALTYTPLNRAGDTLTGALNQAAPVDVTAAGLTNIGAVNSNNIVISGATPITSLGNIGFSGVVRRVTFAGGNTLVHNASTLALPGNANITTVYGDVAEFLSFGDGSNWRCVSYTRSDGTALVASAGGVSSFNTRTGAVTLTTADVTTALGYTPLNKAGDTLTGALNEAAPIQVPSAATVDLNAVASNNVTISGTTTITGFGTGSIGNLRRVVFTGALTLTHNSAGIQLPGAANIVTANGDVAEFLSLGASVWKCTSYQRANGRALVADAGAAYTAGTGLTLTGNAFSITPSGVTAGTYTKVTVDATGRVTTGLALATADVTNALGYTPLNKAGDKMLGALNEATVASVASAATVDLSLTNTNNILITGTTTITSLGGGNSGDRRRIIFNGALTLTHNASSLVLPGSANILTASGDVAEFLSLGTAWKCISYNRADGTPVAAGSAYTAGTGLTLTGNAFSITPTGVGAGTFKSVTVDATGRVTAGTNPTTLAGYGITDALAAAGATMTGAFNEAPVLSQAIGSTTTIGARPANTISLSGSTSITAFDPIASGVVRRVIFEGTPTLIHNATSMILPTGANIVAAAGDTAEFVSLGSGNWRCLRYDRINGQALVGTAAGGVTSFNTRTGAVTLTTADVTTALGYTPVNKAGDTLTGVLNEAAPVSLAAASNMDIASANSNNIIVTGNTTIATFAPANPPGMVRRLRFTGSPLLGNNLQYPGSDNIQAQPGDICEMISLGEAVGWKCVFYTRQAGLALTGGGGRLNGALNEAPPVTLASASSVAAGVANSNNIIITGNVGISSFGTPTEGQRRLVQFTGTPILTNGSSFALPTGANIQVEANDTAEFIATATGWICTSYQRKSGAPLTSGSPFTTAQVFNGSATAVALKTRNAVEQINISATAPTGTVPMDVSSGAVLLTTAAAAAAWTLNVRHSSTTTVNTALAVGDAMTVTHLATQGATPFLIAGLQIDGSGQTIRWQGDAPTAGNANAIDSYVFTIIKTAASTYTVLGSMSKFA